MPGGGMPLEAVPVEWEVATDDRMAHVVQRGTTAATPSFAHAVHVEVDDLEPGRWYWYRFRAGGEVSTTGRTRTAPPANAAGDRLRFAFASCQQYEQGYFTAYRHMLADDLDLIIHVGDYIYESSWGQNHVRKHGSPQPCAPTGRGGAPTVDACQERLDSGTTRLGDLQERWPLAGLDRSTARWNVIPQQPLMAQLDRKPGPGRQFWTAGWAGYPAAR